MLISGINNSIRVRFRSAIDGSILDLSALGASDPRIVGTLEYTNTSVNGTSVGFLTNGSDGIIEGDINFTTSGEWEVFGFVTINGVELESAPARVWVN